MLGATPTRFGPGLADRVAALAPGRGGRRPGHRRERIGRGLVPTPGQVVTVADYDAPRLGARLAPTSSRQMQNAMRLLAAPSPAAVAEGWFSSFLPAERAALYPGQPGRGTYRELWSRANGSPIRRLMQADLRTWLPDNLLERGDRMSMANSVESRPVFLDHSLATLALSLPDRVRVNGRETKSVVKAVALRYLPRDIVYRRKVGFRAPLGEWFRHGLRDVTNDLLRSPDSLARSMFTGRVLDELIDRHQRGDANEEQRLWALLSLEIWHRTCVRNAEAPSRPGLDSGQEISSRYSGTP